MKLTQLGFLAVCFLLLISANSFLSVFDPEESDAELPLQTTVRNEGNGGNGDIYYLKNSCNFTATFIVEVTNLELLEINAGVDLQTGVFRLSDQQEKMYYHYSLNAMEGSGEIIGFIYVRTMFGNTPEAVTVFAAKIRAALHLADACENANAETEDRIWVDYEFEILANAKDGNSEDWYPYPVCDYSAANEIFSCKYFQYNAPGTGLSGGHFNGSNGGNNIVLGDCASTNCEATVATRIFGGLSVSCPFACNEISALTQTNNSNALATNHTSKNGKPSIYPNPFADVLAVQSTVDVGYLTDIWLISSAGQVIYQSKYSIDTKVEQAILNVTDVAPGLYFLVIRSDRAAYTQKLLKQ